MTSLNCFKLLNDCKRLYRAEAANDPAGSTPRTTLHGQAEKLEAVNDPAGSKPRTTLQGIDEKLEAANDPAGSDPSGQIAVYVEVGSRRLGAF